ncbi:MAG: DUF5677 domain-containing protein [Neobacillus sp.]
MNKQLRKVREEIENVVQSVQLSKSTRNRKALFNISKEYQSDRSRICRDISRKYTDLFAIIHSIRRLSILGVQNLDLLVLQNEVDSKLWIYRYTALKAVMIKYIDVFDEIILLIENGFPDGAMQRWRTFLEYSIIILFILEQGEEVAAAYNEHFIKSIEDELRPRTNYAWVKVASCLKNEKQISVTKLLEHINHFDDKAKKRYGAMYKFTSQSIHGSAVGINLSFNDHISFDIHDSIEKDANYYAGGISTVITHTMALFHQTFLAYFEKFPDGGLEINKILKELSNEYVKEVNKSLS